MSWEGSDRLVTALLEAGSALDEEMQAAKKQLGEEAANYFALVAPKRTFKLMRSVRAIESAGGDVIVRADAENKGYDYVGVTRFGHRKAFIVPVRAKALRFQPEPGGPFIFRSKVRGYHPTHDWAEDAYPFVERAAERAATRLGGRVVWRIGT